MPLLADSVRLSDPGHNFVVEFRLRMKAKRMHMIARGDAFDFRETGIIQMPRQHNVTDYAVSPQTNGGKTHSHLKGNAGFFRNYTHPAALPDQLHELSEERYRMPALP